MSNESQTYSRSNSSGKRTARLTMPVCCVIPIWNNSYFYAAQQRDNYFRQFQIQQQFMKNESNYENYKSPSEEKEQHFQCSNSYSGCPTLTTFSDGDVPGSFDLVRRSYSHS